VIHTSGPAAPDADDADFRSRAPARGGAGDPAYDGARGAGGLGRSLSYFRVTEEDGGGLVIALGGEFDITSVGPLEATVVDLVVEAPSRLVFDLGELTFMDPCGLAVLVTAARAVPVGLRRVPPLLRRMIELTGLAELLPEER
jgi:anti-anti-sigma factor